MHSPTLYRPEFERDSCGFGLIAQMDNQASHWLVKTSINSLARLTHRGAVAADGKSGDDGTERMFKIKQVVSGRFRRDSRLVAQLE